MKVIVVEHITGERTFWKLDESHDAMSDLACQLIVDGEHFAGCTVGIEEVTEAEFDAQFELSDRDDQPLAPPTGY